MLGKSNYLRYKKNKNFSVIFNEVIEDDRLSEEARMYFIYIMHNSDSWNFNMEEFCSHFKKSKHTISKIINDELVKYGYVKKDWQFSGMAITPKKSNTLGE